MRYLDTWLRVNGNQRNPGTTADLVAGCLFVVLRDGLVQTPPIPASPPLSGERSHHMSPPADDASGGSSGKAQFRVRVTKDHLVFSPAHFITFAGGICERLHGHNWRTAVELTGPLDENHYVFDFIALRDALQKIVDGLDHRVLLPTRHPKIRVEERPTEVEATFENRRWLFPREDSCSCRSKTRRRN